MKLLPIIITLQTLCNSYISDLYFPAGILYWVDYNSYPIVLRRRNIADTNTSCSQTILDTDVANNYTQFESSSQYWPYKMQLNQDYVYVAYRGTETSEHGGSGFLRINKHSGAEEILGTRNDTGGDCRGLHIHGMYCTRE